MTLEDADPTPPSDNKCPTPCKPPEPHCPQLGIDFADLPHCQ
jgi:hypothetical protein